MSHKRVRERRKASNPNYNGPFRRADDRQHRASKRGARVLDGEQRVHLSSYIQQHQLALQSAWQRMLGSPTATIMTVFVIGIALALPAALKVFLSNAQQFGSGLDQQVQITIFLKPQIGANRATALAEQLRSRQDLSKVTFISADEAFQEFQAMSGFGDALRDLKQNPLPDLLVVTPAITTKEKNDFLPLVEELRGLPESDKVQLDLEWLQRLYALLDLVRQGTLLITVFLIIAVIMVVGNTIRLMSQSYRDEIQVNKLVGATDAFVRRPFLYTGMFYGLIGGTIAWTIITFSLTWLNPALDTISGLYHDAFDIRGLGIVDTLTLICTGVVLGLGGSWIAVGRFLRETQP
ncbi:MAG: permease-like cell division protein FtsX [Gammaproteobacteria bacterium]|nr:permease-like cell division protein FtsX [Gammaproteobacteria bacterium]